MHKLARYHIGEIEAAMRAELIFGRRAISGGGPLSDSKLAGDFGLDLFGDLDDIAHVAGALSR